MSTMTTSPIRQLPLHEKHVQLQAKLGHFGDWEVPLYYTSILEEHEAVRSRAGLFDISHMGKFYFSGGGACSFLDEVLPRNIAAMKLGQALYMPLPNDGGGFVDDIIVYRIEASSFYIIVNAGNIEKDYQWFLKRVPPSVSFIDLSPQLGLIAIQGPKSLTVLDRAFPGNDFSGLGYYKFKLWRDGMVARTGYTGEDGFEIMVGVSSLPEVWDALMASGCIEGILPVGFGARDTLRLEAGMPLYGHDINDDTTPLDAGLSWSVDLSKPSYPGAAALKAQRLAGAKKKLVGIEMLDRGIPRQDCQVSLNGNSIGVVTSGSFSPTLKKNIAMAYVPVELALPGIELDIIIRDKAVKAKVVSLPFYKRTR